MVSQINNQKPLQNKVWHLRRPPHPAISSGIRPQNGQRLRAFSFSPGTPSSPFPRARFQTSFTPFDKEVREDKGRWKCQLQGSRQKEGRREERSRPARARAPCTLALPPAMAVGTWWMTWDVTPEPGLATYSSHFSIYPWKVGDYDTWSPPCHKMSRARVSPYFGPFHYLTIWSLSEMNWYRFASQGNKQTQQDMGDSSFPVRRGDQF